MKRISFWLAIATLFVATLACGLLPSRETIQKNVTTIEAASTMIAQQAQTVAVTESASGGSGPATSAPPQEATSAPQQPATASKSTFPIPADAKNVVSTDQDNGVNFQTGMTLKDAMTFYKTEFEKQGLKQLDTYTAVTDTTFSIVFGPAANGKKIVVQGVSLGNMTNINVRYEAF